jgi:hypothetical protein
MRMQDVAEPNRWRILLRFHAPLFRLLHSLHNADMSSGPARRSIKSTALPRGLPFSLPERPTATCARKRTRAVGAARVKTTHIRGNSEITYENIVDFILGVTELIWSDCAIGRIYDAYDHACTVFRAETIMRSVEELVADCTQTLHAFREFRIDHLNVAWREGSGGEAHTSYIGRCHALNAGDSCIGPATGGRVSVLYGADRVSRDFRIHAEWRIYDTGALVRQLGADLHQLARRLAEIPLRECWIVSPQTRLVGQAPREPLEDSTKDVERWAQRFVHTLWNLKRLDLLATYYRVDVMVHAAGGRRLKGLSKLCEFLLAIQASLPDAVVRVEQVSHSKKADGVLVAIRWILEGTTRVNGLLGDLPANKPVFMLGINHLRFAGSHICEEWMLFDELSILTQAFRRTEI